ncbi:flagellar biosynthesis/type III secretory pathway chaperone [Luteibacter rhizovicinus]|uniref:Flagellar biosynthesis/type III secretory pathway chaperone n=1 Tax=Luteibacter rhizovicinus TaxID=242606 RepID=A0A4R3YR69_9GAMM|nr:flagellar protein FlgN [Luteibacter rhizovicinus]TCV94128.1 flagellar biosynthesis/type III secretory pathway chaperone [Luteibacter rhizovicinus]
MSDSLQPEFHAALGAVMGDLARETDALHENLIEERMALDAGDATALEAVGKTKGALLDRIDKLDIERRQLSDAAGIDALADERWTATIASLNECRHLNEVNGRIVAQRIVHVRDALALLTGGKTGDVTYGPTGLTRSSLRSAPLAQA